MSVSDLPALNAALNTLSGILLALGFFFIRRREIERHRACMVAAFATSVAFLASYVVYHSQHGSTPFPGTGWVRPVYYTMLASHVLLAMAVPPLAVVTLSRGLRRDDERHRRIARITFPVWMYVSVTGVLVYWVLYHAYGARA